MRLYHLIFLSTLPVVSFCTTTEKTLTFEGKATVSKLSDNFEILSRLGQLPVKIDENQLVQRYQVSPELGLSEYLVVVMPKKIDEKLAFKIEAQSKSKEGLYRFNDLIDLVLRSQRHHLRGEVEELKSTLELILSRYGPNYASHLFEAYAHLFEGDLENASSQLERSIKINPNSQKFKEVFNQ